MEKHWAINEQTLNNKNKIIKMQSDRKEIEAVVSKMRVEGGGEGVTPTSQTPAPHLEL